MNNEMQAGMAEATRLTLAGRLVEATAAIQRALGTVAAPDVDAAGAGHVAGDSAPAMRTPGSDTVYKTDTPMAAEAARPDAAPPWPSPDVLRRPAGRPGAPGRVRPVTPDRAPAPPGQFVDGAYTNAAGTRSYKLYVPSG